MISNESEARAVARKALDAANVPPSDAAVTLLAGRIKGEAGIPAMQHVEALRADANIGHLFQAPRPSYEGKKWNEMTPDEKVAYTDQKYGS